MAGYFLDSTLNTILNNKLTPPSLPLGRGPLFSSELLILDLQKGTKRGKRAPSYLSPSVPSHLHLRRPQYTGYN